MSLNWTMNVCSPLHLPLLLLFITSFQPLFITSYLFSHTVHQSITLIDFLPSPYIYQHKTNNKTKENKANFIIANGGAIQQGLKDLTGQNTVPNVFIGGKHVGGCDSMSSPLVLLSPLLSLFFPYAPPPPFLSLLLVSCALASPWP